MDETHRPNDKQEKADTKVHICSDSIYELQEQVTLIFDDGSQNSSYFGEWGILTEKSR